MRSESHQKELDDLLFGGRVLYKGSRCQAGFFCEGDEDKYPINLSLIVIHNNEKKPILKFQETRGGKLIETWCDPEYTYNMEYLRIDLDVSRGKF